MASSITTLTPTEANEPENTFDVKVNSELHRRHTRKYPTIEIGDKVTIYKKNDKFDKEHKSVWLKGTYTVSEITEQFGHKCYKVGWLPHLFVRSETLNIYWAIQKDVYILYRRVFVYRY